jgi:hypothetical protein
MLNNQQTGPTVTNKFQYPQAVVQAVISGLHQPEAGKFGVTSLLGPPAIRGLRLEKWNHLSIDVDDQLPALFGQAWHKLLEENVGPKVIAELELSLKYEDVLIRGRLDELSNDGVLADHKTCSAIAMMYDKTEWVEQLNVYGYMAEKNGYPVSKLRIHAFLKDWNKWDAMRNKAYPKRRFHVVDIPKWPEKKVHALIAERVADHKAGIRPCTPEEMWERPSQWAVHKNGIKRARKLCDSPEEAEKYIAYSKDKNLYVNKRLGQRVRCENYCMVACVCPYYKEYIDGRESETT